MTTRAKEEVVGSDLTKTPVHEAFGEEVNMFTHIHLRGYDRHGNGKEMHADYYDKYGAPMKLEESWLEGYRAVEKEIAEHYNKCINPAFPFPTVAASAGGSHLYSEFHHHEAWNWTGWVPDQKKWCCADKFYSNRHFISLRGNEVQNNLWDYHPFDEEPGSSDWDDKYKQLVPRDAYKGGYFFFTNAWGRYLHIITLKSMGPQPFYSKRYNYIVHPLAYRANTKDYPDNSVDAMQWCINNVNSPTLNTIPIRPHQHKKVPDQSFPAFGEDQLSKWGDKCHGLEIFNDFTYYYSSTPLTDGDNWQGGNGYLHDGHNPDYIHWFNSYPHEMGEFLLETSLRHGTYIHALAANDAMYQRADIEVQHSDPKSTAISNVRHDFTRQDMSELKTKHKNKMMLRGTNEKEKEAKEFLDLLVYKEDTVFGYTALIDPEMELKKNIYGEPPYVRHPDLNQGELGIFDHIIEGRFFAHTGVYGLFNYRNDAGDIQQHCPIMIENQDSRKFYYDYKPDLHEFNFTLPKSKQPCPERPCDRKSIECDIVWQFTVEVHKKENQTVECHRGYFKLNENKRTQLYLNETFDENEIAWIRIQGYDTKNPQRRAWFQAIRGPMFNKISWTQEYSKKTPNPPVTNIIHHMTVTNTTNSTGENLATYKPNGIFTPHQEITKNLIFDFKTTCDENYLCVYNLQVMSPKQNNNIPTAHTIMPPAYLQNVCGVFGLSELFPTKLNLNSSWDKDTVKDGQCMFYMVSDKAELRSMANVMKA